MIELHTEINPRSFPFRVEDRRCEVSTMTTPLTMSTKILEVKEAHFHIMKNSDLRPRSADLSKMTVRRYYRHHRND
ncbi:hypothetical protein Y032_0006g3070 [Ancylostoma ceylanicum]|uniref:Uncharacterized protein n=1 Tax=Ancylostoma ceylanicum TaxID=53326 RepID=A0A016VS90_9BILA|nr:hypothetical protein Y032_0006g3070 [Ancylostoma ceylanicum]